MGHWVSVEDGMAELDERIERLENDLVEIKKDIKNLLVELKVLMARDQNPLADQTSEVREPSRGPALANNTGNTVQPAMNVHILCTSGFRILARDLRFERTISPLLFYIARNVFRTSR